MADPTEPLAVPDATADPTVATSTTTATDDTARIPLRPGPATATDGSALPTGRRRHRIVLSARVRILGWVVLLLAFAGASALLLQRRVLLDRLDAGVDADLRQEVDEVRRLAGGRNPETGEPFAGDAAAILDTFLRRNIPAEGEVLLALVPGRPPTATTAPYPLWEEADLMDRWSAITASERGEVATPEGTVRYVAVPLTRGGEAQGVFVVAFFLDDLRSEISDHLRVSALVYGAVMLVAVAVAWLVAGRVLAPIRSVTDAAKQLSASDLSRRIDVPASDDEVAALARTFNAMLDRLEAAFGNQRRFLDDAGHELRTPITIIRGHLELEGDDPHERRATRAVVLDELDRMARIVEDLLVLARSERPDFLRPEDVDLDLLTTDLFAKCRALAERDWRLGGTGLGIIRADRQRLTQAVMNLADNAVRHTGPGDAIELGSALRADEAAIWVDDTGPGVPLEQQERIFERFARAEDGRHREGTAGLGLAIVRSIALAHGGRVGLDSRPGSGARFTITIPADGSVAAGTDAPRAAARACAEKEEGAP
ncbi:MAG TPA: ATP-binding protein [Acidimicrobiales bacterium]